MLGRHKKTPKKSRNFLDLIKQIYEKPTANIVLNEYWIFSRLDICPSDQKQDQDVQSCYFYLTLLRAVNTRKRNKRQPDWKGRHKTVFADGIILIPRLS